jgi:hypothetical protein
LRIYWCKEIQNDYHENKYGIHEHHQLGKKDWQGQLPDSSTCSVVGVQIFVDHDGHFHDQPGFPRGLLRSL